MSGGWRQRLTGEGDEFSGKGPKLTSEQREHLTRVTDELLQRYTISRSDGADGDSNGAQGEPVSADEIDAVLESVLADAFDFGWFTRSDLPEAPELELEQEGGEQEHPYPAGSAARPMLEPLDWPDPRAEEDQATPSAADWGSALGPRRAADP